MFRKIFLFFAACIPAAQNAAQNALPSEILSALKSAGIPQSSASFLVVDAQTGATLLSHQADKSMNPASVMKLVTTAAALDVLTPQFTWRTDFLTTANAEHNVLNSPLYIRASGDPKITWEDLERVFVRLREKGISELKGGVVIDKSVFAPMPNDVAAFDRSPLRPYNVTPDAMLFNFKAAGFKISPQVQDNSVRITPEPFPEGTALTANVKLTQGACGDWKSKLNASFDDAPTGARVAFSGSYAASCGEREWFVSLLSHDAFFEGSLRWMWKRVGGIGNIGTVKFGAIPTHAQVLDTHISLPLTAAVSDVNKFSNNVMARHLLLTIDRAQNGAPAQSARGANAITAWLKKEGIDTRDLVLENGSGLSRDERVSANFLAALLRKTLTKSHASEFIASLPIAGVDGTLSQRFNNSEVKASASLKTGGLNDVRSLAGYLRRSDGRTLIYIGILNHPRAPQAFGVLERAVEWAFLREIRS
jgi:serine-type D-Ala-D-Ala carboxypeptidase/endopeptidase (penicillin-binding protein 4)